MMIYDQYVITQDDGFWEINGRGYLPIGSREDAIQLMEALRKELER